MMPKIFVTLLLSMLIVACATSPLGRKQFILIGDSQMNQMGIASFQKMKTSTSVSTDTSAKKLVSCVATAIIEQLPTKWKQQPWEIVVFEDKSANAFALPGGKMGVHTGLLKIAKNQSQLAAVIGHEIAHVISRHGAERVSQSMGLQLAMSAAQSITENNVADPVHQNTLMSALGLGAKFGVQLPFSRKHETEADLYGLDLMAKAGFDPRESVELWKNMSSANKGQRPPEFISTHPDPENRINRLNARMPSALKISAASGKSPHCQ